MQKSLSKFRSFSILVLLLVFVCSACKSNGDVKDQNGCKYLESFKLEAWQGKITNKYIDQTLNNAGVIAIDSDAGNLEINDAFLSDSTNYELIKVGDSIVKLKGELVVHLYNSNGVTEIETDFDCPSYFSKE